MNAANIPAGQLVRRTAGEIIFRVGEGVRVGSLVHLRDSDSCKPIRVEVAKIISNIAGVVTCSTVADSKGLQPAIPEVRSSIRALPGMPRKMCPCCMRWYYGEECPREGCN